MYKKQLFQEKISKIKVKMQKEGFTPQSLWTRLNALFYRSIRFRGRLTLQTQRELQRAFLQDYVE